MAGLFDTFTVAKRGLNVQQGNINVTSHNIANANTPGFSRQRAVVATTKPFGGTSKFDSTGPGQIGTGAQITTIQRIRDTFIDYQYRNENGKLGNYEVQYDYLAKIEDIFAEPSDEGIQKLFSEFYASFQELAKTPENSSTRTIALQKAAALADALNNTYSQLENKINDCQSNIQFNIIDVNSYLDQINDLNKQIRFLTSLGQSPNDLMDSRDKLLDDLSKMMGIKIENQNLNSIDLKADAYLNPGNPIDNLVNSEYKDNKDYTRFSYVSGATYKDASGKDTDTITVTYTPLGDSKNAQKTITIDMTGKTKDQKDELVNSLLQNRMLIADENGFVKDATGNTATSMSEDEINKKLFITYKQTPNNSVNPKEIKGEIAGNQGVQDTIKGYMSELDKLAATLAYSVNAIQTGSLDGTDNKGFDLIFINADITGGNSDNSISAKNITVNQAVLKDVSKINCSSSSVAGDRNGDRAQAIAQLAYIKFDMSNIDSSTLKTIDRQSFLNNYSQGFNGVNFENVSTGKTMDSYYKDMISTLGTNTLEAKRRVGTETTQLENIDLQRVSVSGVSLDEETTNLIQYQHAYSANAKMIATVDELLDVVINGLKR